MPSRNPWSIKAGHQMTAYLDTIRKLIMKHTWRERPRSLNEEPVTVMRVAPTFCVDEHASSARIRREGGAVDFAIRGKGLFVATAVHVEEPTKSDVDSPQCPLSVRFGARLLEEEFEEAVGDPELDPELGAAGALAIDLAEADADDGGAGPRAAILVLPTTDISEHQLKRSLRRADQLQRAGASVFAALALESKRGGFNFAALAIEQIKDCIAEPNTWFPMSAPERKTSQINIRLSRIPTPGLAHGSGGLVRFEVTRRYFSKGPPDQLSAILRGVDEEVAGRVETLPETSATAAEKAEFLQSGVPKALANGLALAGAATAVTATAGGALVAAAPLAAPILSAAASYAVPLAVAGAGPAALPVLFAANMYQGVRTAVLVASAVRTSATVVAGVAVVCMNARGRARASAGHGHAPQPAAAAGGGLDGIGAAAGVDVSIAPPASTAPAVPPSESGHAPQSAAAAAAGGGGGASNPSIASSNSASTAVPPSNSQDTDEEELDDSFVFV
eukprot:tig00000411_g529.t1